MHTHDVLAHFTEPMLFLSGLPEDLREGDIIVSGLKTTFLRRITPDQPRITVMNNVRWVERPVASIDGSRVLGTYTWQSTTPVAFLRPASEG